MSRTWMTNESSSFARSFGDWCHGKEHQFINSLENDEYNYFRQDNPFRAKEIDIFDPTLPNMISRSGADIIIHQLPITPDRSLTSPDYALRYNIEGTYYVIEAAKEAGIPILFVTTRNYNSLGITSKPDIYNITARTVEQLLDSSGVQHLTVIPPIIYGLRFDEGISGLVKTAVGKKEQVVLNLNPEVKHPFMPADSFFDAMDVVINNTFDKENSKLQHSTVEIIPPEESFSTLSEILKILEGENLTLSYDIRPKNDNYGESHNLKDNVSNLYGWSNRFSIIDDIKLFVGKVREEYDSEGKK